MLTTDDVEDGEYAIMRLEFCWPWSGPLPIHNKRQEYFEYDIPLFRDMFEFDNTPSHWHSRGLPTLGEYAPAMSFNFFTPHSPWLIKRPFIEF